MRILIAILFLFSDLTAARWNRIYLASYPRSGTHWVRYLVENASSIATGSVYLDRNPRHLPEPFQWGGYSPKNGCYGNCRYPTSSDLVLIKTHFPAVPATQFDLKEAASNILLIRHPVDAIASFYRQLHPRIFKESGKIPRSFIEAQIKNWRKFLNFWIKRPKLLIIRYEDILRDPESNLMHFLNLLNYTYSYEDIQRAITQFPPTGKELKHVDDYHSEDLQLIRHQLADLLQRFGYQ